MIFYLFLFILLFFDFLLLLVCLMNSFGISVMEGDIKLFDIFFDITNIKFLGESSGWEYFYTSDFNLRKNSKGIYEITVFDFNKMNFIGKEQCSMMICTGKFKDGLMHGEWIFDIKGKAIIKGKYDDHGMKTGMWSITMDSNINFFNMKDDLFHGETVVNYNGIRCSYIYEYGYKKHTILSLNH